MSERREVPHIVGITGYAQHGKNTVAEVFEGLGYRPVAFADALRELAEKVNPYVNTYDRYHDVVADLGYEEAKRAYPEVRRILQELGTGVRDIVGENSWVNALTKDLMPGVRYVITDVRFPNEASAVTGLHGEVWKVVRPDFDNGIGTEHPSEALVHTINPAVWLLNTGSVDDLKAKVKHVVGVRGLLP